MKNRIRIALLWASMVLALIASSGVAAAQGTWG